MRLPVAFALVAGCSRPQPIAPDPTPPVVVVVVDAPAESEPTTRSFMEDYGDKNCYHEIRCHLAGSTCDASHDGAPLNPKKTAELRADHPGKSWCCFTSTVCELPYE